MSAARRGPPAHPGSWERLLCTSLDNLPGHGGIEDTFAKGLGPPGDQVRPCARSEPDGGARLSTAPGGRGVRGLRGQGPCLVLEKGGGGRPEPSFLVYSGESLTGRPQKTLSGRSSSHPDREGGNRPHQAASVAGALISSSDCPRHTGQGRGVFLPYSRGRRLLGGRSGLSGHAPHRGNPPPALPRREMLSFPPPASAATPFRRQRQGSGVGTPGGLLGGSVADEAQAGAAGLEVAWALGLGVVQERGAPKQE